MCLLFSLVDVEGAVYFSIALDNKNAWKCREDLERVKVPGRITGLIDQ